MPNFSGQLRIAPTTRFAIVASRWNPRIVDALIEGARRALTEHGATDAMIDLIQVPGAWEIPVVAAQLAATRSLSGFGGRVENSAVCEQIFGDLPAHSGSMGRQIAGNLDHTGGFADRPTKVRQAPRRYNAIIALGCVVRGDTRHYEHVADGCAQGLMRVALDHGMPVLNGVLAVERHADALARAGGAHGNKGADVALAAVEMVDLFTELDIATQRDRKGTS